MAILVECPTCRCKQSQRNKFCKCGEDLDRAKRSKRVKYHIRYRMPDGKQKTELVGTSKKDADDAHGKRKTQKRENRTDEIFAYKKETTWTFDELARWWLNLESVKARSDHERVAIGFSGFNEVFGSRLVKDLKLSELKGYQAARLKEGRAKSTTDHETHSAAKAAVRTLWTDGEITRKTWRTWENFKKLISGKKARKEYARTRVLEIEEYCRLRPKLPAYQQPLLDLALFTGMRKSEILTTKTNGDEKPGLSWKQIDRKRGVIHLTDTKTGIPRDIPITDEIRTILDRIPRTLGMDAVFTYRGKAFSDIRNGLIKACEKAGILYGKNVDGGFMFGDLRRTAKTLMTRAGVDKAYRDAILGHESQDMDRHYLHPDFEKDLRTAMAKYTSWLQSEISNVTYLLPIEENSK